MLRTTFFASLVGLIAAKLSGQGVVITPGPTTFGPPLPVKPKNGECPICHTQNPPIKPDWDGDQGIRMVICTWCGVVYAQKIE